MRRARLDRRRLGLFVAAVALVLAIAPAPASAGSFAAQTEIGHGCVPSRTSTAINPAGALHIFANCEGSLKLFIRIGSVWREYPAPPHMYGNILSVAADETGVYVLTSIRSTAEPPRLEVELTKRNANGTWYGPTVLSRHYAEMGGAVVARGGKWWAVWSEQISGYPYTYALFEAHSMLTPQARHQITSPASGTQDRVPSLAVRPAGGVVMAWARVFPGGDRGIPNVRVAVRAGATWRSDDLDPGSDFSDYPTVVTVGSHMFFGWNRRGLPVVATDESARLIRRQFRGNGCAINVVPAMSAGRLVVGYNDCTADGRAGTIVAQVRGPSGWSGETVWNGNYLFAGAVSTGGKATLFMSRDSPPFATFERTQG